MIEKWELRNWYKQLPVFFWTDSGPGKFPGLMLKKNVREDAPAFQGVHGVT